MIRALALLLLFGCNGEASDDPDAEPPRMPDVGPVDFEVIPLPDAAGPWIELGTGSRRFSPLTAGQEIPVIMGIQGGFHVWGGFRSSGFPVTETLIDFILTLDGEELAAAHYLETRIDTRNGAFDYAGVAVVYARNEDVQPTSGRTMRLDVRVRDGDTVLTDSIEIVPVCCQ